LCKDSGGGDVTWAEIVAAIANLRDWQVTPWTAADLRNRCEVLNPYRPARE
jgi:hypothetical protein